MKRFLICFLMLALFFSSCTKEKEYTPLAGKYTAVCKISGIEYLLTIEIEDDLSGKLCFSEECVMSDWYYFYSSADKKIKKFSSLGEASEEKSENVKYIFRFILADFDNIASVSQDKISGVDVSIFKMTDGALVYTDSKSGAPLRFEYGNMTVDIISRPQ